MTLRFWVSSYDRVTAIVTNPSSGASIMLKAIKKAWTLTVNVGWIVVLGGAAWHFQAPATTNVAEKLATAVPAISQPQDLIVQKPIKTLTLWRAVKEEHPQLANTPQDVLPERGGTPAVICEGGMCRIDPRYKFDPSEPRVGPEPVIYFPQPEFPKGIPPGETPRSSKAKASNDEMRFQLNQFKARLKWTPKVALYLDLSNMGACPWELERIFDQNWELKWRIRQLSLLTQGYATEGMKVPNRPRGKEGYIGVYPSTITIGK